MISTPPLRGENRNAASRTQGAEGKGTPRSQQDELEQLHTEGRYAVYRVLARSASLAAAQRQR